MVQLRQALTIGALILSVSLVNYYYLPNNDNGHSLPPMQPEKTEILSARFDNHIFDEINLKLCGPETYAASNCALCGCFNLKESCPPHYSTVIIQESANFFDAHLDVITPLSEEQQADRALEAMEQCGATTMINRGGFCLEAELAEKKKARIPFGKDGADQYFTIQQQHMPPPPNMVMTLL